MEAAAVCVCGGACVECRRHRRLHLVRVHNQKYRSRHRLVFEGKEEEGMRKEYGDARRQHTKWRVGMSGSECVCMCTGAVPQDDGKEKKGPRSEKKKEALRATGDADPFTNASQVRHDVRRGSR